MIIRRARPGDRDKVLAFCTNTFGWGDYIEQVWDYWYENKSGQLLVAESDEGESIALSHVALCPGGRRIWVEGIRVHPAHRRSQVATKLIETLLRYGRKKGAAHAYAIVAADNSGSQKMMEKNGFKPVSRWAYYSTAGRMKKQPSKARLATTKDIESVWSYLKGSRIYRLSARTYVRSWHWYDLDLRALKSFINKGCVIVTGMPVGGIAVINRSGYWKTRNVLQVVYLDSLSKKSLEQIISYVTHLYVDGEFERLQVLCQDNKKMGSVIEKFRIEESERFVLYNKVFTT